MKASVEDFEIRPYFNAGLVAADPGRGILRAWRDNFHRLYGDRRFESFYRREVLYRIFMHQAVLAGTIMASIEPDEMEELSFLVSYPLHMHLEYPVERRPEFLNDLITIRYEKFFQETSWPDIIAVKEPLKSWLETRLALH